MKTKQKTRVQNQIDRIEKQIAEYNDGNQIENMSADGRASASAKLEATLLRATMLLMQIEAEEEDETPREVKSSLGEKKLTPGEIVDVSEVADE